MEVHYFILYAICLCIFLYECLVLCKVRSTSKNKLPPGPKGLPIVGNLFMLGKRPHESLAKLAKAHGPLMTLQLGFQTTMVVSSADMAREVLQKNDHIFAGRTVIDAVRILDHHKSSIVFSQVGPRWRLIRRICKSQMFNAASLDALRGLRQRVVEQLLEEVQEKCRAMESIDVGQFVFKTVTNFISNTMFSVDLMESNSGSTQELKDLIWEMMEIAGTPNVSDYFPVLRPFDLQGLRRANAKCLNKLYAIFDEMINQRLRSRSSESKGAQDLLDVLLDECKDSGSELKLHDLRHVLLDFFLAGIETTTSTVEWAMSELLHNRHTIERAQSEINEIITRDQAVNESNIIRLPYLQAVVKETLRLHPPAPFLIPHKADATVELVGFMVPKHTQVLVNAWAISRDDHFWKDPHTFSPERFLDSQMDFKGHNFQYIPFGAGRRICPGIPLADQMVHLILASLLHSFDWKLRGGETPEQLDMSDKFGLTLRKATPLLVIPYTF